MRDPLKPGLTGDGRNLHREIVLDQATIAHRVRQLASRIDQDYRGRSLLVVGVLQGAVPFTCDLVRHLTIPFQLDFIALSHFSSTQPAERVRVVKDIVENLEDRHLLLVEDLVDTGLTLHFLIGLLSKRRPATLSVCALLDRRDLRLAEVPVRYRGFKVKHPFLVGYGLDYRQEFRDLPDIVSYAQPAVRANCQALTPSIG